MQSSWKITQDQPGEQLSSAGLWPPNAPRALHFDKAAQQLIVQPYLGKPAAIHFSTLRGLRFLIGPESGRRLTLQLSILYTERNEPRATSLSFRIKALDRHEEALDWIFRVAQILGWPSYLLYQKDERGIELELRPESHDPFRADAQATHEVPEVKGPADYSLPLQATKSLYEITRRDPLRPRFQEPAVPVSFAPNGHPGVVTWSPPAQIVLRREGDGPIVALLYIFLGMPLLIGLWLTMDLLQFTLMIIAGLVIVIPLLLLSLALELPDHIIAIPGGLIALLLVLLYLNRFREMLLHLSRGLLSCFSREVSLSLDKGSFVLRRARFFWSRLQLSSISAITLTRRENKMFKWYFNKNKENIPDSCYEVRARVGPFRLHLWEGKEEASPKREECYALAVSLARVLDVPFREE